MKWSLRLAAAAPLFACIGISADSPTGGYGIAELTVTPRTGPSMTVHDAGRLEFGGLGNPDPNDLFECTDTAAVCGDAVSILAYTWLEGGLVPLWAPERVLFALPEWDGPQDRWVEPIPLGDFSCTLTREQRRPTIFVGDCTGPSDDGPFEVELVMDR